jgi:hypothetical protein
VYLHLHSYIKIRTSKALLSVRTECSLCRLIGRPEYLIGRHCGISWQTGGHSVTTWAVSQSLYDSCEPKSNQPAVWTPGIISQNCWIFLLRPSSGVLGSRNTTFRKLGLFPSSGEGEEKIPTQLGPLEKDGLWFRLTLSKGPNWVGVFSPSPEDGNRCSFRNVVFILLRTPDDGRSPKIQ